MIRKRTILALCAYVFSSLLTFAQTPSQRPYRIGLLSDTTYFSERATALQWDAGEQLAGLRLGMKDLGVVEGKDWVLIPRIANRDHALLDKYAAELVAMKADVIVASSTTAAIAAHQATRSIPIVAWAATLGDTVPTGKGSNITGFKGSDEVDEHLKQLQMVVPGLKRVAVLYDTSYVVVPALLEKAKTAAKAAALQLIFVEVKDDESLAPAFDRMVNENAQALLVLNHPRFHLHPQEAPTLALKYRLPMVSPYRESAEAGGLIAHHPDWQATWRRGAKVIKQILDGTPPGEIPGQTGVMRNYINVKTANALGLTIPDTLRRRCELIGADSAELRKQEEQRGSEEAAVRAIVAENTQAFNHQDSGPPVAAQIASGGPAPSADERVIAQLEDQCLKATLHGDTDFPEKYFADDYTQIALGGNLTSKQDQIRFRKTGQISYQALDLKDRTVRIYGDIAVVVMHSYAKYTGNGRPIEGDFRATRVWHRQNGMWKIVAFQTNKVESHPLGLSETAAEKLNQPGSNPGTVGSDDAIRAQDESAIRKHVSDYVDAYNAHNSLAMDSLFADDHDTVVLPGRLLQGKPALHELFIRRHSTIAKSSHLTRTVENIRFLKSDVAVVDGMYEATGMTDDGGNPAPPLRAWVTEILTKTNNQWRGVVFRAIPLARTERSSDHPPDSSHLQFAADARTDEEAAIRKVFADYEGAWNRHDAAALASFYTADGDAVFPSGKKASGRSAVQASEAANHSSMNRASNTTRSIENVRFVTPNVALVDSSVEIAGMADQNGERLPHRHALMTTVLVKQSDAWQIAANRAMVPATTHAPENIGTTQAHAIQVELKEPAHIREPRSGDEAPVQDALAPAVTEREILNIEAKRRHAILEGDVGSLDSIIAGDFIEVTGGGTIRHKSENIEDLRTGRLKFIRYEAGEEHVRLFDSFAIYTARIDVEGTLADQPFGGAARSSRIYVSRHGHWLCVYAQNTRLNEPGADRERSASSSAASTASVSQTITENLIRNNRVQVSRITHAPRQHVRMHYAPPMTIVFLTDAHFAWLWPEGKREEVSYKSGDAAWFPGGLHASESLDDHEQRMMLVVPVDDPNPARAEGSVHRHFGSVH